MDRPRIVVHAVASVDGRVTLGPDVLLGFDQEPRWDALAGGGEETERTHRWLEFLYQPQAFLEGSGTFVRETEEPTPLPPSRGEAEDLEGDYLPEKVVHPEGGRRGWFLAVDGRGRVRNWTKEFPGWDGWHSLIW